LFVPKQAGKHSNDSFFFMNSILLENASKVVPNTGLIVNMVRQRVRQLLAGARPMILVKPGLGMLDIALSEIAANKLTSERVLTVVPAVAEVKPARIISFPNSKPAGKAA
jgi:DNA-directed RNA polymerase subunit K/omega